MKAIKTSHQNNVESRKKFFYEAQITGDLDHPNIVPIHELGASQEGMLFYSMKLIGGTEWKDVIKKNSREENLDILLKVCDAVAFAHSKHVIHRDLKPENTMLGTYGEVFVTDWGLAVNLEQTRDFTLGGTPVYMSPEMAGHDLNKIGPTSDIYVLGGILYQIVTGRGPHPGRTVTECLRAALKNEIVDYPHKDPLLDIAKHAMAKDPKDRYATVADFQAAIRQYRLNAESIAIANRSEEIFSQAVAEKDYEKFSRSIFGYRDALELWSGNEPAAQGLAKARLAYGQCAYDRSDFDLCIGTLDRSVPEEAALFDKAVLAKKTADEREQRFKKLRKVLAATITGAVIGLSVLSAYAMLKRYQAEVARNDAVAAKQQEEVAKNDALQAKNEAVEQKNKAQEAHKQEEVAKKDALRQKEAAELAQREELAAKEIALQRKAEAESARDKEAEARVAEEAAKREAQQRAAEVQLGNYQSTLALAKAQLEQFDTASSRKNLEAIATVDSPIFTANNQVPKLDSWAWQRLDLLSNHRLPRHALNSPTTTADYSDQAKLAVIGTSDGRLVIFDVAEQKLTQLATYQSDRPIEAAAVSSDGNQVVFSISAAGEKSTVYLWKWRDKAEPTPIEAVRKRSIQGLISTRDGKQLVAGINSGLWNWDQSNPSWFTQAPSQRIEDIHGRLRSMQLFDDRTLLVVAELNQLFHLHRVELGATGKSTRINLPMELAEHVRSAAWSPSDQRLLLGLDDGRLFSASMSNGNQPEGIHEILPRKHQSSIHAIAVHPNGTALTNSREPVVHVWRADAEVSAGWSYDTFLAGTLGNVDRSLFAGDPNRVLGIDEQGEVVIWDIAQQKRLRLLPRYDTDGTTLARYSVPVINVVPQADLYALSVDANGVVDKWTTNNGQTVASPLFGSNAENSSSSSLSQSHGKDAAGDGTQGPVERLRDSKSDSRWTHFGHLPGSIVVDAVIDEASNRMITSASLRTVADEYRLPDSKADYEFCLWNTTDGNLIRRWTKEAGVEQRLSLLDQGGVFIASDDKQTQVLSVADGSAVESYSDFGTYFAVAHPLDTKLAALVKRSGAVRILDLKNRSNWENKSYQEFSLANNNDVPSRGAWSPDGRRFYLLFASGRIARFDWSGLQFKQTVLIGGREKQTDASESLHQALDPGGLRMSDHFTVDFAVDDQTTDDLVHVIHRRLGKEPSTKSVDIAFPKSNSPPKLVGTETKPGLGFLPLAHSYGRGFEGEDLPSLPQLIKQFASTKKLINTSYTADGKTLLQLYEGGTIRKLTFNIDGAPIWSLPMQLDDSAKRIAISPDGSQLAVLLANSGCKIFDISTGTMQHELDKVVQVAWDRSKTHRLAAMTADNSLILFDNTDTTQVTRTAIANIPLNIGEQVQQLSFFAEFWKNNRPATRYLMLHSETEQEGRLRFIPLDPEADTSRREPIRLAPGAVVTPSPTDSLLAVGQNGLVTLWLCLPTLDQPRPLYNLEGHRGASLRSLTFTQDGKTLISTDNQKRVLTWLSDDHQ